VTNVLDTLWKSLNELLVENTNSRSRIVMPVDTDYSIVFPTGLAVFEELLSGRCGEFLIVSSISTPSPFHPGPFGNLAEDWRIHRRSYDSQ